MARKQGSTTDNVSHLFAELDPDQPASDIIRFVTKVMLNTQKPWVAVQQPSWVLHTSLNFLAKEDLVILILFFQSGLFFLHTVLLSFHWITLGVGLLLFLLCEDLKTMLFFEWRSCWKADYECARVKVVSVNGWDKRSPSGLPYEEARLYNKKNNNNNKKSQIIFR